MLCAFSSNLDLRVTRRKVAIASHHPFAVSAVLLLSFALWFGTGLIVRHCELLTVTSLFAEPLETSLGSGNVQKNDVFAFCRMEVRRSGAKRKRILPEISPDAG